MIYIYIYGHSLNQWAKKRSKFQFFPQFYSKNDAENPQPSVGVFHVSMFCLLSHLCLLLALVFHHSLCFLTFWVRFGSVTVRAWSGSSGSGFRLRRFLCGKGFQRISAQFKGVRHSSVPPPSCIYIYIYGQCLVFCLRFSQQFP